VSLLESGLTFVSIIKPDSRRDTVNRINSLFGWFANIIRIDTVGEFPKQRTYVFYPAEFKELTRLRLSRVDRGNFTPSPSQNRI
jgi:hypothetical protein